jgi:NAD(P)-dependent dehydrogenase (short-subunit alcohol dehydrogenase family)
MTTKLIVLITGATRGIGLATAGAMARAGHTVLLGARDPGRGTAAALNGHTGVLSADEGGAHIARQLMEDATGVFLNENGGTYPW